MKKYIAVIEIDDDEDIVGDATISYTYRSNGTNYGTDESVELKAEDEKQRMKTYEDGLNDAWECVKKITCVPEKGGLSSEALLEIFNDRRIYKIIEWFTPTEVIEKIREYEVHVGDEIYSELTDCKAVVQRIDSWNRYQCFNDGGAQFVISPETFNEYWIKTGKNYPQIAEILKQMKESN